MAYEMKVNQGSLWKNEKKESDTHADYNGSIMLEDGEHWLNCWINTVQSGDKAGRKYLSLSVGKLKQPSYQDDKPQSQPVVNPDLNDDLGDIPF